MNKIYRRASGEQRPRKRSQACCWGQGQKNLKEVSCLDHEIYFTDVIDIERCANTAVLHKLETKHQDGSRCRLKHSDSSQWIKNGLRFRQPKWMDYGAEASFSLESTPRLSDTSRSWLDRFLLPLVSYTASGANFKHWVWALRFYIFSAWLSIIFFSPPTLSRANFYLRSIFFLPLFFFGLDIFTILYFWLGCPIRSL